MQLRHFLSQRYFRARTLGEGSEAQYVQAARTFSRWLCRPAMLADFTDDLVNDFLRSLARVHAPSYVRSRRTYLLAIWRFAAEDDLVPPPRRIRRVGVPQRFPIAWERSEVERLLFASKLLIGSYPKLRCGRAAWWSLAIRVAWDSGLRRCDQTAVERQAVRDGWLFAVQRKTEKAIPPRPLAPSTLAELDVALPANRRLLCPWPYSEDHFCGEFRKIVEYSGLVGTWHKLRRSSGTAVEAEHPGFGAAHLGDTDAVFRRHYLDPRIAGVRVPGPRPLAG